MKFKKIPQYIKNIISGETKIRLDIQHKSKELAESIFEMSPSSKGKENSSPYSKLVAIDGIAGFAGSSAITDFLAEFSECTVYGGVDMRENPDRGEENNYEVDFFRDAYGVLEFVKWYKWYAERYLSVNNKDLLLIRFEDFVLNYDKVSKEITKFIGLPLTKQIKKNAFFNPDISKNNIGIYKTYEDQNAIEYIAKNLKKYLYTKA